MLRKVILTLLLVLAACDDTPVSPRPKGGPAIEIDEGFQTVTGTVVSQSLLQGDDGSLIPLMGPQTSLLANLTGAEVRIRGASDEFGATALWIVEFRVLQVDGLPALDGTLVEYVEGFAVEVDEGRLEWVESVPDELAGNVGRRVWITTSEGHCIRFGVLEM